MRKLCNLLKTLIILLTTGYIVVPAGVSLTMQIGATDGGGSLEGFFRMTLELLIGFAPIFFIILFALIFFRNICLYKLNDIDKSTFIKRILWCGCLIIISILFGVIGLYIIDSINHGTATQIPNQQTEQNNPDRSLKICRGYLFVYCGSNLFIRRGVL